MQSTNCEQANNSLSFKKPRRYQYASKDQTTKDRAQVNCEY